jgi:hypothetical protein
MQNRDGVGRRSQSYLPTLVEQALDNAARLIHEYRLPVQVAGAHPEVPFGRLGFGLAAAVMGGCRAA